MIFWDSSALARAYFESEPGHARAKSLLRSPGRKHGSALLRPETASGVVRRYRHDRTLIEATLDLLVDHLKDFDLVPIDDDLIERAVGLIRKHSLRGADALHLAGALVLARDLGRARFRFVTADAKQAAAAREEGLKVIQPE